MTTPGYRCPVCDELADEWEDDCEHASTDGWRTAFLVHAACLPKVAKPKCICAHWGWPHCETTVGCPVHDPKQTAASPAKEGK